MILPLYGGWSEIQLLNFIATGKKSDGLDLVQATFKEEARGIDATSWAKFLHDGFLTVTQPAREALRLDGAAVSELVSSYKAKDGMEIVFVACAKVDDGRYANNGWLQELPDPVTKVTWDNAALLSPTTARKLGLEATQGDGELEFDNGAWLTVEVNGALLNIPASRSRSATVAPSPAAWAGVTQTTCRTAVCLSGGPGWASMPTSSGRRRHLTFPSARKSASSTASATPSRLRRNMVRSKGAARIWFAKARPRR
jgi:hypothetical protein